MLAIDRFVTQSMAEHGTPGLALAVTTNDSLLAVETWGYADLKEKLPVTPETLFQIGSITKSFTAIALLQLQEAGMVDLRAQVTDYLPWFIVQSDHAPITAHDLLTHSAGIPANRDDLTPSPYMAWALRGQSTAWAPGDRFAYSNVGYQVLHYLLEGAAGATWQEVVAAGIFRPLGMSHSTLRIDAAMRPRQAVGYTRLYDDRPSHTSHPLVETPFLEYWVGDGAIASTPGDLASYARMLLNRGRSPEGRILTEESFELFSTRWIGFGDEPADDSDDGYGYGIDVTITEEGHPQLRHSGGMVGFTAQMVVDPDSGLGVVAFINGPGDVTEIADFVLAAARAALAEEPLPEIPEPADPLRVETPEDYAGSYEAPTGEVLEFQAGADALSLRHGTERLPLENCGRDAFFALHPDFELFCFRFARNDEGTVTEVSYGSLWYPGQAYDGPTIFDVPESWLAYPGQYRSHSPWATNFRLILRKGELLMVTAAGGETGLGEEVLVPAREGLFHVGDPPTPETLRLDTVVEGKALRAVWSGHEFYRTAL